MSSHMAKLWLATALLAPFAFQNQGCGNSADKGPASANEDDSTGTGDQAGKRGADLELCEPNSCKGPALGAPNYQCRDGSVAGPVCAKKDLGDCGWLLRACPEEAGDGGQGEGNIVCGSRGSEPCPKGTYCQLDESCGALDQGGECVAKPEACPDIYAPVCGCDGKTYGNACEASASGVSVASKGECSTGGGAFCGGIAGIGCADGDYCDFGKTCGASDQGGQCTKIPQACYDLYSPVCGCDDKTYGNDCDAAAAGVSVLHTGECEALPCDSCKGPAPGAPNYVCEDGSLGGPACVHLEDPSQCGWVFRQCPKPEVSNDCHSGLKPAEGCWTDEDCGKGGTCEGAICCPVGANCFAADRPGKCG